MAKKRDTNHPKPETIGKYRVVYPIYRDDTAEVILTPIDPADDGPEVDIILREKEIAKDA